MKPIIFALILLGVSFVILKLCKVISWSWWFVTSPFWIIPAIIAVLFILAVQAFGIAGIMEYQAKQKAEKERSEAFLKLKNIKL